MTAKESLQNPAHDFFDDVLRLVARRRCPYTQEQLKRAFKAGKAAGFDEVRVEMIEPDTGRKWVAVAAKPSVDALDSNPWDEVSK